MGPGGTPEETFESMREASVAGDWEAIFGLMSERAQQQIQAQLGKMQSYEGDMKEHVCQSFGITPAELDEMDECTFFTHMMKVTAPPDEVQRMKAAEVTEVSVDGDHALLRYQLQDKEEKVELALIDGRWFVDGV